jgi:hypothetical protein
MESEQPQTHNIRTTQHNTTQQQAHNILKQMSYLMTYAIWDQVVQ